VLTGRFVGGGIEMFAVLAVRFSGFRGFHRLAARGVVASMRGLAARAPVAAAAAGAPVRLVLGLAMRALLVGDQRLPVGDRDLIVIRMDFGERQKAVAVAAVVDEGGLQRRLYPRDLGEVDVAAQLAAVRGLEIEFLDPIAAQYDHPGLLGVGGVDKHFVCHETISGRRANAHPRRVACDTRGGRAAPNWGLIGWRRDMRAKASAAAPPSTLICSTGRRG
jgi:hypothetical protein